MAAILAAGRYQGHPIAAGGASTWPFSGLEFRSLPSRGASMRLLSRLVPSVLFAALTAAPAAAQIDARMLRQPDVSATQIAFVYAGDIWVAPKQGGVAVRLSSPRGEESFPRFSPDGKTLAYSANYDGNTDVYTVPVAGRRADAPDLAPDDRSRARLASRRHAGPVRLGARERAAALQPVLPGRRQGRSGREAAGPRTASSPPSPRTASSSPTCRSRRRSARGSAIAAAGRPTSGRSTWRPGPRPT